MVKRMFSVEDNINACRVARRLAAQSLQKCLHLFQDKDAPSEMMIRDAWLAALRENDALFPDGWYSPPPYGISILFGNPQSRRGYSFQSLRPRDMWPHTDVFFDREAGFFHAYASAVNRETGMIGDFGMTVYTGGNQGIKNHLQQCLQINREIFEHIEVGRTFAEVYQFAMRLLNSYGLSNDITSVVDITGTNIGHTIPALSEGWTNEETQTLRNGHWDQIQRMIGAKRKFVSSNALTTYQPGMAVTIEPRPTVIGNPSIPMAWYHSIVVIHQDGSKELLTGFEPIFKMAGMDYMLGL
jgi:Metallopeptidase family M24